MLTNQKRQEAHEAVAEEAVSAATAMVMTAAVEAEAMAVVMIMAEAAIAVAAPVMVIVRTVAIAASETTMAPAELIDMRPVMIATPAAVAMTDVVEEDTTTVPHHLPLVELVPTTRLLLARKHMVAAAVEVEVVAVAVVVAAGHSRTVVTITALIDINFG